MNERLKEILARKQELRAALEGTGKVDLPKIEEELRALTEEEKELEERKAMAEKIETNQPVEARQIEKPVEARVTASFDSVEYREAFMEYVCHNTPIPAEYRADANTTTGDIGAVVPPTTLNRIIEKIENYGNILPLVTKTNYKSGVAVPVSSVKPVATWVKEGAGSDKQKKIVDSVVFSHYKLRCAVSVSLEAEYMSLSAFEDAVVKGIANAMAKALEEAVISGTGNGQPTGILADVSKAAKSIATAKLTYKDLVDAESALPMEYETGAVWVMTKKTFGEFVGMTDSNGQPIARVNYGIGGAPERVLLGRRVVLTNSMTTFTTSLKKTDVFAFLFDMSDYVLNTNLQVSMKVYEDNETDDVVRKSIVVCDGRPVDVSSLFVMTGNAA